MVVGTTRKWTSREFSRRGYLQGRFCWSRRLLIRWLGLVDPPAALRATRNITVPAAVVLRKIATIIDEDAHPLPYPYRNIKQKAVVHQDDYKLEVGKHEKCTHCTLRGSRLLFLAASPMFLLARALPQLLIATPFLCPVLSCPVMCCAVMSCPQIMRGGVLVCTVQIYLLGGEQGAAQYMVEFLRGQVRVRDVILLPLFCFREHLAFGPLLGSSCARFDSFPISSSAPDA